MLVVSAIVDFTDNDLVMGGDWNLVLNNRLDKDEEIPHMLNIVRS